MMNFRSYIFLPVLAIAAFSQAGYICHAEGEVGLQAIFREASIGEAPWGLRDSDFEPLPEDWKAWGQETRGLLETLYGFDPLDLEKQNELLASLRSQLAETYPTLSTPSDTAGLEILVDLEGKLARRLAIYEALIETVPEGGLTPNDIKLMAELLQALGRYESDDRDVDLKLDSPVPPTVPQLIAQIEGDSPEDYASLLEAVRVNYYNFNFRTFVSEPFADHAFYECRRECGPVCDCILGARVRGTQRTKSGVYIDFLPSKTEAKFAIRVNGNTRSNTTGVTSQATVYTSGNHYFNGYKVVHYDGEEYSFSPAKIFAKANNHIKDAKLNRRGLLAVLIGDKIALQKAQEKKGQSEAIAASRLRNRVKPKFDREIESTFGDLNEDGVSRRERMVEEGIAPNDFLARTDDDEMRTAERLMNYGQLGADRATTVFNTKTGMTLHIHESWVNNALAIDTIDLKPGDKVPFPQFTKLLTEKFRRAFDRPAEEEAEVDENASQVEIFDIDPFHVQFEAGHIKAILRVALHPEDKDDVFKLRRIEVPLNIVMEDNQIRLEVSEELDAYTTPLDRTANRIKSKFAQQLVKERFQERLAEEAFDRSFVVEANDGEKEVPVRIASIHPANGWLIVVIEPDEAPQVVLAE